MRVKKTVFELKLMRQKICTLTLTIDVPAKADIKLVSLTCCIVG